MPRTTCLSLARCSVILGSLIACGTASAQTVWSGLTLEFAKPDDADWILPENQDQISPNVMLTRADTAGLFNIAQESAYQFPREPESPSPLGTRWATAINVSNLGKQINASNWAALDFTSWKVAYGGGVGSVIVGKPAVVHLIAEDVYLDIQFTSWTSSTGGGFSYLRAEGELPQPPSTTGDYNLNGIVDAADYTVWRDTLNENVTPGEGADGDESGTIDPPDYDFWKQRFGETVPLLGEAGTAPQAMPEPATLGLMLFVSIGLLSMRSNRQLWNS